METLLIDRLRENMKRLKLHHALGCIDEKLAAAEERSLTMLQFLDELLDEESTLKEQRRIETSLRLASLPFVKTIDEYDFSFQPDLDRRKVMSLFDLTFLEKKENVFLLGPPGVGKTHLAVSLAMKACRHGASIYFTTMSDLIEKLKRDREKGERIKGRSYYKSSLVIVDEVGYTPVTRAECNLFFRFVSYRYESASMIITSNKAFADWAELFEDPVIVSAVLDRLLHHSVVINIKGNSYRLKEKILNLDRQNESA